MPEHRLHRLKIIGIRCTGACLPGHCQPWALPNIGSSLQQLQLDSNQLHAAQTRTRESIRTFHQRDWSTLYECKKNYFHYNMKQFTNLSFTIKLQFNIACFVVVILVNFIYWAIIYRVVYIFTLLLKRNWVVIFISKHYT